VPPEAARGGTYPLAPRGDSGSRAGAGDGLADGRYPVTPGCWSSGRSRPDSGVAAGVARSAYSGAKKVGVRGCGTDVSRETSLCTVTSLPLLDDNLTASETRTNRGPTHTRGQPTALARAKPVESTGRALSMAPTGGVNTTNPDPDARGHRRRCIRRQPTTVCEPGSWTRTSDKHGRPHSWHSRHPSALRTGVGSVADERTPSEPLSPTASIAYARRARSRRRSSAVR
jgi:hypothetical protein